MALLLLDAATMVTTNFLPCQTTNSLFFILPQECFHQVVLPKALPMLPSRSSMPRRRPVIPKPSQSQIAMQKKGLELTLHGRKDVPTTQSHTIEIAPTTMTNLTNATSASLERKQANRSSSVYSTESAHSTDSTETTISQIVEMYTDLISKIPRFESSEVNILQPKAYRDTVAPLLQRRFSADNLAVFATSLPSTKVSRPTEKHTLKPPQAPHRKAPGFQEFSQNLRDRRAQMVSPMSIASSNVTHQSTLDNISLPSPATPGMRPFSFISDNPATLEQRGSTLPLAPNESSQTSGILSEPKTTHIGTETALPPPSVLDQQQASQHSLRYIKSEDIFETRHQQLPEHSLEAAQSPDYGTNSDRFYRNKSTGSASTDSFVIYTGLGETMKAMIKEKMNRRKKAKETAKIMTSASQRYPAIEQELRRQSREQRRSSLTNGVNSVLRKVSLKESTGVDQTSADSELGEALTAIPLTPYQKLGLEAWTVKNKKKRKEERQREREAQLARETSISSTQDHKQTRKRTVSSKTSSTIESSTSPGKKNSLMTALEGARNSLTYTSAEKRREKLKESIVLLGPTQLTHANVSPSSGAQKQIT